MEPKTSAIYALGVSPLHPVKRENIVRNKFKDSIVRYYQNRRVKQNNTDLRVGIYRRAQNKL